MYHRAMARPLRIEYPGALYHVTSRGNARAAVFHDDGDRTIFLSVLGDVVTRHGWLAHAYCLMGNHYHLLIETPQPNLSHGMRQLNGVYTQRYHRRHGTVGHLFQARYHAVLVEKESHLLELCRYVVLNPVRAGMVARPEDWPWSSYRQTMGGTQAVDYLFTDWVLAQFGERRSEAREAYRRFVEEGVGTPAPWAQLKGRRVLGSDAFAAACRQRVAGGEALAEVPAIERQVGRPALEVLLTDWPHAPGPERDRLVYRACVECEYRLKDVAQWLGVHPSTISRAVRRAEQG